MQQVSRKLLFAGVLAFGTLTAACGDKVEIVQPVTVDAVQSVTVSPSNATLAPGGTITLGLSVVTTGNAVKTVTWSSSNSAIAAVDQNGKVSAPANSPGGTVTILAQSTANPAVSGAAAIVVTSTTIPPITPPQLSIQSVTQNGIPVNLSNTAGQIDVTLNIANTSGNTGAVEVFMSTSCTTNTIGSSDVLVATQSVQAGQAGPVVLSFNTAQLTSANAPRFPNNNYCIKSRLTSGTQSVVATLATPITLNNANVFRGTLQFVSATGGPISAVSSLNGLQYNQGNLTATVTPAIFTSSSPVALISGYLTRNGEQANGGVGAAGAAVFNNIAVTNGVATITFTDTGSVAGVRSIWQYTSLPAGDTLYITAATDASGSQVTVPNNQFVVVGGNLLRIDNDIPNIAATTYTVTAPNGYIGAAYAFSSGQGGTAAADVRGVPPVQGVGGVTTTWYVGAAGSAAFATANSCNVTGLTAAAVGTDLPNTTATNADQAKVVVRDALGNQTCLDVASTFAGGLFGVDKIAPNVTMVTTNNGASDVTGYNVSKNFSFVYNDTISGFNPATPLRGTLIRNFFTSQTAADCVIGTFSATALTCVAAPITVTSTFGTPPNAGGSIEFTGGTGVVGYYRVTANAIDQAGNPSAAAVTRIAAFDNVAPTVGAVTQSPAAVAPLGTVTVSATAADNFDLATSRGNLVYNPAGTTPTPVTFARVTGTSFGPNFDATLVTSGTATVALPNVYRGLQGTTGAGVIVGNAAAPTATITVTDVGTNVATSGALAITMASAPTNIQVGNSFVMTSSVAAAPATQQATTTMTVRVVGATTDPAFQSQPFSQVDIYKAGTAGELAVSGTSTLASVTDQGTVRTYTYQVSVPLSAGATATGGAASVNTFFAVGRNASGDAVISQPVTITNP